MQQSLIRVYENEDGDIVLMYVSSNSVDATDRIESQSIIIDRDDVAVVSEMLYKSMEGE